MHISKESLDLLLRYGRGHVTLPITHLIISPLSAQYIAAYPRSGCTWLRTMLVNILSPLSNSDPHIFNQVIPGCSLTRLRKIFYAPTPRILSTHSIYRSNIKRAIYIVRDGRDSIASLYRYTTIRAGFEISFDRWFSYYMKGFFGPRWDQHVESWCGKGKKLMGENFHLMRYEDCCKNPHAELEEICEFLNISYTMEDINRAVIASSLENMRIWEQRYVGKISDKDASFYRGRLSNEWEELLSNSQKKTFLSVSESALRLGEYI